MGGGVIMGTLWGVMVAAVVLAAVSLSTPLPPRPDAIPDVMDDGAADLARPSEASMAPGDAVPLPEGSGFNRVPPADVAAAPDTDNTASDAPDADVTASAPAPDATVAEPPTAPLPSAETSLALPQIAGADRPEAPPATPRRLSVPETTAAPADTDLDTPDAPVAPDPGAATDAPETPAPQTATPTAPEAAAADPAPADTTEPAEAPTSRLPQITAPVPDTDTPAASADIAASEAPRLPQVTAPTPDPAPVAAAPEPPAAQGALIDNAAPFDTTEDRPLMAIILIDDPEAGLTTDTLTRFSFPVAFAIDPLSDGAAERAETYRAAGFEVVILADILPDGATPADAETALAAARTTLPQAVALLDTPESRIQTDRPVLDATVAALAETGHGLVAFPRGLNAAEQTAARADVPAATLFRQLDDEDQRATVITRFLTRAGFAAVSEGSVIVAGRTRPDTVTALFSWALGSRSEAVAIAPLSAVLLRGTE